MYRDRQDHLIDELTKVIYVYRMTQGHGYMSKAMTKSVATRRKNAKKKIDDLIYQYASDQGWL